MKRTKSDRSKLLMLTLASLVVIVLYVVVGLNSRNWQYALSLRLPKVIAIVVTGCAIAFSTVIFQTVTNNRILTPSIMGLDSLYLLLQSLAVFIFGSTSRLVINPTLNFLVVVIGMIGFAAVLYRMLFRREDGDLLFLLLVGVIMGTLFDSGASFVQMVIDPNEFTMLQNRMFASFNNVNTNILWFAGTILVLTIIGAVRYMHILDVLALGREQAVNLGVDYDSIIRRLLIVVAVLVSVSTGLVGPIMFLGLLVANLAREVFATYKHKYLLAGASLIGILALVSGQLLAERVFNFATPISVLINLIGGLYFILLLLKESRA